jgi:hypothetical protein
MRGPRVHCRHVTRGLTPQRAGNGSAALRETLTLWKADPRYAGDADYVIATVTGRKANPSNLRRDALAKEVTAADVELAKHGVRPIGHVTFHGLRRTFSEPPLVSRQPNPNQILRRPCCKQKPPITGGFRSG